MCTDPQSTVWVKRGPKWVKVPKPCGDCWQCRENYVNDWVGRCLAEAATSAVCCTLSLTYAPPKDWRDISHRVVQPLHFQLFMKRLRKAGHKVRYLVAGEYGEDRGRAHFHCILFFQQLVAGKRPARLENRAAFAADPTIAAPFSRQIPQEDMCHIREWPYGHIVADWSCTEKSIRYVCEYLQGDNKDTAWFQMSKKPALGAAWFAKKAQAYIEADVLPSSFEYLPPGGKPGKVYLMTGATRRDFLNAITKARAKRGRMSKWVGATFDKLERQDYVNACAFAPLPPATAEPELTDKGRLEMSKRHARIASYAFQNELIALALDWGFDNVEEFEAFRQSGGCDNHPEYYRGRKKHVPGVSSPDAAGNGVARSAPRQPTTFDRQGNPVFNTVEVLPNLYDREVIQAQTDKARAVADVGGAEGSDLQGSAQQQ